jgi:hypothetical protein
MVFIATQIMQGYLKGILVGLIGCAITLTIGSTTLVGTTSTKGYFLFLL